MTGQCTAASMGGCGGLVAWMSPMPQGIELSELPFPKHITRSKLRMKEWGRRDGERNARNIFNGWRCQLVGQCGDARGHQRSCLGWSCIMLEWG